MSTRKILVKTIKDAKALIERVEKDLAALEVTCSIGDRFKYGERKFILTGHNNGSTVVMSELSSGIEYNHPAEVEDNTRISVEEMEESMFNGFSDDFTRYWDARKQEKC